MTRAKSQPEAAASANTPPMLPTVDVGEVARRAYERYQARGCEPGHDVEDWLEAEQELQGAATPKV